MKKARNIFVAIVFGMAATFAVPQQVIASSGEAKPVNKFKSSGARYLRDLSRAIQNADEITITEHSSLWDYYRPGTRREDYKEKIYGFVKLTPEQKTKLFKDVSGMSSETQNAFASCIFEPHHRIAFYRGGHLKSAMEICFKCGQVEWNGSTQTQPWSLYEGMSRFISDIGLRPSADWRGKYDDLSVDAQAKS